MSATQDRTRQDATPALLAWHVEEAHRAIADLPGIFRLMYAPYGDPARREAFERHFAPFLEELQEASDQFARVHALVTGHPVA